MSDRAFAPLAAAYADRFPEEAARALARCAPDEIAAFLAAAPLGRAATLLDALVPDVAADAVARLAPERVTRLLARAEPTRVALVLSRLDAEARAATLARLPPAAAHGIASLLAYPPDTAGALMETRVVALHADATAAEAVARLRRGGRRPVPGVFVVDDAGVLQGAVPPQTLLVARDDAALGALVDGPPVAVGAMADRDELVAAFERSPLAPLAVVDVAGALLGAILPQAVIAAARAEDTADLQTMVGAGKTERALSPVLFAVRKRLPWLEINLLTAFLAAAVVGAFEDTIARYTALAVLLPVVAGQSGNTGAQALAVTMRGLALREIHTGQWLRVATKESVVGALNGVAVALTTGLAVLVWSGSVGLALVIVLSMVLSMVVAGLAGAVVPVALTATGQDPAQSSSIVLTTVTDVVGFFTFLGIATLLASLL